jgi:hypothetical protein
VWFPVERDDVHRQLEAGGRAGADEAAGPVEERHKSFAQVSGPTLSKSTDTPRPPVASRDLVGPAVVRGGEGEVGADREGLLLLPRLAVRAITRAPTVLGDLDRGYANANKPAARGASTVSPAWICALRTAARW